MSVALRGFAAPFAGRPLASFGLVIVAIASKNPIRRNNGSRLFAFTRLSIQTNAMSKKQNNVSVNRNRFMLTKCGLSAVSPATPSPYSRPKSENDA